jgi:proline dehydrogenase
MRLSKALAPFAKRFVAGETAADAIAAARRVNQRGIGAILDFLGEDVDSREKVASCANEYRNLLKQISDRGVDAAISIKASQMGLLISPEFCVDNVRSLLKEAEQRGLFVWIDMEGSALTQKTIDLYQQLREGFKNVGLCVQAHLVRTGADVDVLIRNSATLRLCKGAYREPPQIAYRDKRTVDGNYLNLAQKMLRGAAQGVYAAFATHDLRLIGLVREAVKKMDVQPSQFEFQMLYGIQNAFLETLAREGFRTRVYIPYGTAWLPYFLRRLRERKENIYFLLKNAFRR